MSIRLLHLFAGDLSSSGDSGNVQTVAYRLRERGFEVETVAWDGQGALPEQVDAVFIGNGPWSAAVRLLPVLMSQADALHKLHAAGVPFFAVGTGAELLATNIIDAQDVTHAGVGIFDFESRRDADRRVGYMRVESTLGTLIGFGDFASEWRIAQAESALGKAVVGDRPQQTIVEGVVTGGSVASRMGGPMLPLNPALADVVVATILKRRGEQVVLAPAPVDEYIVHARALIEKNLDSVFTTIAL